MIETVRAYTGQQPTPGYNIPVGGEIGLTITVPAGVNAVAQGNILIDQSHDFGWLTKSGAWTNPAFEIEFTYPDGSRMQEGQCLGSMVLGLAPFHTPLEPGYLCRAGSRIGYRLTNRTGAVITVDLLLTGEFLRPAR